MSQHYMTKGGPTDIKLTLIYEHSQLDTKRESIRPKLLLKQPRRVLDEPMCTKGILIERSKAQPTRSR